MDMLKYLKNEITQNMQLPELVDIFEKMCQMPVETVDREDDMILFETGTFSFFGHSMFLFSLVRQFPNGEEYFQVHLDVQYEPSETNQLFSGAVWNEDIGGDFFQFVRNSDVYQALKNAKIAEIDIFIDET